MSIPKQTDTQQSEVKLALLRVIFYGVLCLLSGTNVPE